MMMMNLHLFQPHQADQMFDPSWVHLEKHTLISIEAPDSLYSYVISFESFATGAGHVFSCTGNAIKPSAIQLQ